MPVIRRRKSVGIDVSPMTRVIRALKQTKPSDFKLTPEEKARAERIRLSEEQGKRVNYE